MTGEEGVLAPARQTPDEAEASSDKEDLSPTPESESNDDQMDETQSKSDRTIAEEHFAARLVELEDGTPGVLEELCEEHPQFATYFQELHEDWKRVRDIFDAGGGSPQTLSVDLGKLVAGVIDERKEAGAASGSDTATEAAIGRLRERLDPESRLEVQGELARGGMGAVLSVLDKNLRREMAMKVMLKQTEPGRAVSSRAMGRFLDEAQITGQLEHPGIVPVHELGIDPDGKVYFTMKLVQGEELSDVYRRAWAEEEGWSTTRVLGLFQRVCEAMAYAHSRGVIHRDLKPANVMVGSFGEVYVMDWGLARIRGEEDQVAGELAPEDESGVVRSDRQDMRDRTPDSSILTRQGDIMGTPAYMPPEQATGQIDEMDERSDVYAIGAMLYELLAGRKPYTVPGQDVNMVSLLNQIREGSPVPIHELQADVVPELEAICEKAMSHDIDERYRDMGELGEDLRNYLEGRVVSAYETGALAELKKWVRRNRGLANALTAGIFVLVTGVIVSTYFWQESAQQTKNVLRLSDSRDLVELLDEARGLWPAHPENTERLRTWIKEAEEMLARLPEHEATLALLRAEALPRTAEETEHDRSTHPEAVSRLSGIQQYQRVLPAIDEFLANDPPADEAASWGEKRAAYLGAIATLEGQLEERRTYRFQDADKGWWHEALARLIVDLEELRDQDRWYIKQSSGRYFSGIKEVRRRLEFAERVDELTLTGEGVRARWEEARRSIADQAECPQYGGLELSAQRGLIPVGRDPRSGLWEFTHLQSGEEAGRDPETGELQLTTDTGIVFVLIPGGDFLMGAQADDPSAPNFDPDAEVIEGPVHEEILEPFFLSKFEVNQAQWVRLTSLNPSFYNDGDRVFHPESEEVLAEVTTLHPVESVSWRDCSYLSWTQGLALPTEAQWEYAARAGTTTRWWTGDDPSSLEGAENLGDRSTMLVGQPGWVGEEWDDGFPVHAPVNSLRPNPWGLHHILGNVGEWTREEYTDYYEAVPRNSEGARSEGEPEGSTSDSVWTTAKFKDRAYRGPGWFRRAVAYRVTARYSGDEAMFLIEHIGLRPVRRIEP